MNELALFAGAGGGILAGQMLGWIPVCAVEIDAFCARRLMQRQNEGHLPPFPIWDDVRTFNGWEWGGVVDVVSGGFPCQDISTAGSGAGIDGEKSGLWVEFARIVYEVRPRFVFLENSPMLTSRGLGKVLGDLAAMGYDAEWGVLGAADVGAPHQRDRIWIVAHKVSDTDSLGLNTERLEKYDHLVHDQHGECQTEEQPGYEFKLWPGGDGGEWWATEPRVGRVVNGMAYRVDRLRGTGNGQVPHCAVEAWHRLLARI